MMSLVYRAIWQIDTPESVALGEAEFDRWVLDKYPVLERADEAQVSHGEVVRTSKQIVEDDGLLGLEAELVEDRQSERWTTRLRVLAEIGEPAWVWVDLERVALLSAIATFGYDLRFDELRLNRSADEKHALAVTGISELRQVLSGLSRTWTRD